MTNSLISNNGKNNLLYRGFTVNSSLSGTENLAPTVFKVGRDSGTIIVTDTDLTNPIPIENGTTNDDGSNLLTGSNGGSNTTDNTTTYKEGSGNTDVTSQNLIATTGNATKTWTIADLSSAGVNIVGTQPFSKWHYIKDATALAKYKITGTCLEIKFGSDSSNYYSKEIEASDLTTGWNFITTGTTLVNELTETGTVSGDIDTFIIEITTNNTSDVFVAGDIIYDLLRQWATTDLIKDIVVGYPTFITTNKEVTIRGLLDTGESNGFNIDSTGLFNEDTSPVMINESTFTEESKSLTDQFAFIYKNRIL